MCLDSFKYNLMEIILKNVGKKLLPGHLMTNGTLKEYKCYFFLKNV